KAFPIVDRVAVGGPAFDTGTAYESGDEPASRDHIDLRQFLCQADRIVKNRKRIAKQDNFSFFCNPGQNGGLEIHRGAHASRSVMMLIEHQPVKSYLFGKLVFIEIFIV